MPKVLAKKGFAFYFFAADCQERAHMHIKKGNGQGKVWLGTRSRSVFFCAVSNSRKNGKLLL